jgi:hypothetical protein
VWANFRAGLKNLLGRCLTSKRLQHHGLQDSGLCALCSQAVESIDHLLIQCSYACEVWFKVFRRCGWQQLIPAHADKLTSWWLRARKAVAKLRRPAFDSIVLLLAWSLWLQRNDRVFRSENKLPSTLVNSIWTSVDQRSRAMLLDRLWLFGE